MSASSSSLAIRSYKLEDYDAIRRIGANTAFFGQPVEVFMEDRTLFFDIFYAYYTDIANDYCWVASDEDKVAGFLAGCPDTKAAQRQWLHTILPRTLWKLLGHKYRLGPQTLRYAQALAGAWLRREFTHVDLHLYPAHLHVNVAAGQRGHGLGTKLMETYLDQLRALGVPGVHLNTTSANEAACALYEKMGFRLLDSRATARWRPWSQGLIQQRCYGLAL